VHVRMRPIDLLLSRPSGSRVRQPLRKDFDPITEQMVLSRVAVALD
jgi:hypothetical protein